MEKLKFQNSSLESSHVEKDEPSAKRVKFDFFSKNQKKSNLPYTFKDLKPGSYENVEVKFRASLKKPVRGDANKVFVFHGIDDSAEFELVAYGAMAMDLFPVVEVNECYSVKDFDMKLTPKNYPTGLSSGYRIVLNSSSVFASILDDGSLPLLPFNFKSLAEIKAMSVGIKCDVIGIIVRNWGFLYGKTELSIVDETKTTILVTVWTPLEHGLKLDEGQVVAIRNGVVSSLHDEKLITAKWSINTLIWPRPEVQRAKDILEWYVTYVENSHRELEQTFDEMELSE